MAELAYKLEAFRAEVHPYDESTGRDIEDQGEGIVVSVWVPDSRRSDINRNSDLRAELSQMIDELIATTEG